jgi:hypothetical protein
MADSLKGNTITSDLLKRAFPSGPTRDEYFASLIIIAPFFSVRGLACMIEVAFKKDYVDALQDSYTANARDIELSQESFSRVFEQLKASGYEEWARTMEEENGFSSRDSER